jgi:hypothetical protein
MWNLLPRAVLVGAALTVGVWLALSWRAVEAEDDAGALIQRPGPPSAAEFRVAQEDLRRADRFNPDNGPFLAQGQLLLDAGRRNQAAQVAKLAIEKEPENYQGWLLAYYAASDPTSSQQALRRATELNPWATVGLR